MWYGSQKTYSINAMMSRNIFNQFLTSARQSLFEAYRAMQSKDETYAADQVVALVWARIKFLDPQWNSVEIKNYYDEALTSWLRKD